MITARELAVYVLVASFLALLLSSGVTEGPVQVWRAMSGGGERPHNLIGLGRPALPDFSCYQSLRILNSKEFPLDNPHRRVIIVGDVHGMTDSLHDLLTTVDYHPHSDVLIHAGDILAKGSHKGSMSVLSFMARHNITGVRGNHDQKVIEWRGWTDWVSSFHEGRAWLERIESEWKKRHNHHKFDLDDFLDDEKNSMNSGDKTWWKLIPRDWKLLGDHYRIARAMTAEEYDYLVNLPLKIYIPSAHAYIVHAGILASDPRYPYYDAKRQPLARIPQLRHKLEESAGPMRIDSEDAPETERLRYLQEIGVITKVPQNTNPWVSLNMRSVKDNEVSRKSNGKEWFKLWAKDMEHCSGYNGELTTSDTSRAVSGISGKSKDHDLPCYPATVVYGHMASSGLNIRRWSLGLDSGCVYGRKLTALVLGGPKIVLDDAAGEEQSEDQDGSDEEASGSKKTRPKNGETVPFGDHHEAQVISVRCSK